MLKHTDHGDVRQLIIDRPPVNALNPELVTRLTAAIRDAEGKSRALVISGREGMFSAGLDLPDLIRLGPGSMSDFFRRFFGLLETIARFPVPVVSAITGHAPAGGAVMALFCDYRIMTRGEFKIGLNETRVGLVVPGVITHALARLTGPHRAERLVVSGDLLTPEQALECGLVDALADNPEATVSDALDWCARHLELPEHAMLENRCRMRAGLRTSFRDVGTTGVTEFVDGWFRESTQATLRAVLERLGKS
jgi:enoyl-CoA hydratase/carnithine racemase